MLVTWYLSSLFSQNLILISIKRKKIIQLEFYSEQFLDRKLPFKKLQKFKLQGKKNDSIWSQ